MRILVIEDDTLTAMTACAALESAGHIVIGPCHTVETALLAVSEDPADLALIDISLASDTDGVDLAKLLWRRWGIKSIFVTGSAAAAYEHRTAALGLLHKPFDDSALLAAMPVVESALLGTGVQYANAPSNLEMF